MEGEGKGFGLQGTGKVTYVISCYKRVTVQRFCNLVNPVSVRLHRVDDNNGLPGTFCFKNTTFV